MNTPALIVAHFGLALTTFASAAPGDWPQWRGPNRDNVSTETGLLKEWPAGGPPLLWKATDLGGGYSTPSVAGGRVFGSGYVGDDEVVWALDAATGKEIWRTAVARANRNVGYGDGPRATPTVDGDLLYTLGAGGNLVCLETVTGNVRWKKDFKSDFGGRMMSGWGFSESPLVDGDQLVCTPGAVKGTVVALDKKTGDLLWQTGGIGDKAAYSSIVVATVAGVRQYVQLTPDHVVGVAPADGRVLWRAPRRGETAVVPTPNVHDDLVFVTSGYGVGCHAFRVTRRGDEFKAEQVYANKNMMNHHGGVLRVGDHLYGHSDTRGWVCMEMKTGDVVWNHRGVDKGSLTCADGHLYLRSERGKGTVALVAAVPDGYKEISRFDQPNRSGKNSWPHPVVAGGRLYLRDQDVLLCYDVKAK